MQPQPKYLLQQEKGNDVWVSESTELQDIDVLRYSKAPEDEP